MYRRAWVKCFGWFQSDYISPPEPMASVRTVEIVPFRTVVEANVVKQFFLDVAFPQLRRLVVAFDQKEQCELCLVNHGSYQDCGRELVSGFQLLPPTVQQLEVSFEFCYAHLGRKVVRATKRLLNEEEIHLHSVDLFRLQNLTSSTVTAILKPLLTSLLPGLTCLELFGRPPLIRDDLQELVEAVNVLQNLRSLKLYLLFEYEKSSESINELDYLAVRDQAFNVQIMNFYGAFLVHLQPSVNFCHLTLALLGDHFFAWPSLAIPSFEVPSTFLALLRQLTSISLSSSSSALPNAFCDLLELIRLHGNEQLLPNYNVSPPQPLASVRTVEIVPFRTVVEADVVKQFFLDVAFPQLRRLVVAFDQKEQCELCLVNGGSYQDCGRELVCGFQLLPATVQQLEVSFEFCYAHLGRKVVRYSSLKNMLENRREKM
ncbi:hypothetical protein TYRP_023084 [Tyrophagus putrescentiae]|nr:hypothetical protein TYRP_023084 [Tyrophagus putrescentiae]